jgi:hypothetical protein
MMKSKDAKLKLTQTEHERPIPNSPVKLKPIKRQSQARDSGFSEFSPRWWNAENHSVR